MKGVRDYDTFQEEIERGISIVKKFQENFFIAKLMDEQHNKFKEATNSMYSFLQLALCPERPGQRGLCV